MPDGQLSINFLLGSMLQVGIDWIAKNVQSRGVWVVNLLQTMGIDMQYFKLRLYHLHEPIPLIY